MNWFKLVTSVLNHVDDIEHAGAGLKGHEKKAAVLAAVTTAMTIAQESGHPLPANLPEVTGNLIDAVVAASKLGKV